MSNSDKHVKNYPLPAVINALIGKYDLVRVLAVGFVFGLVVLLVREFGLENRTFLLSLVIACIGFPIHHVLPKQLKLPFFVFLSFTSIIVALGIFNAAWLIGLGSLFIILAHLPIPFYARVTAQVILGLVLIVFRADLFPSMVPSAIWPILGSMFIFRLMIYMYDLRLKTAEFGPWRALAYFFMVPNVNFTLLPVIDYKNLFLVYYPKKVEDIQIYQKGIVLLVKGVFHLLLYRLVYQNVLVDPATIVSASDSFQYLVGTFLLYLRISGYFHMISGILHMYGFNLPETHHLYFLASSFTDFWRRINIFWKDFMQKIFFYPVHFWLTKRMGPLKAVSIATVYAFFLTWILHAYQWFWIRGDVKLSAQDGLFWGSLGVAVLINLLWEMTHPKKRSLKGPVRTWKSEVSLALKTILTFLSIVFIWNVWSTPDFGEFKVILSAFTNVGLKDILIIGGFCISLGGLAVIYGHKTRGDSSLFSFGNKKAVLDKNSEFWKGTAKTTAFAVFLLYLAVYPTVLPGTPGFIATVTRLGSNDLNERDRKLLQRGYYEDLTDVSRFNPELQSLYKNKPVDWAKTDAIVEAPGEFPPYKLLPSMVDQFKGKELTSNSWGIRDKEYATITPPDTYRLAVSGASHTFGSGVGNDETYEALFEERLNTELTQSALGKFESLNFSLGGYGPASKVAALEKSAQNYDVDGFVYVAINDLYWVPLQTSRVLVDKNEAFYFDHIRKIAKEAGVEDGMSRSEVIIRLTKHTPEMVRWYYSYLADLAKKNNIDLWIAIIPIPEDQSRVREEIGLQATIAKELGIKVIDITDTYNGVDKESLWVTSWDKHPTLEGQQLLADRFYEEIHDDILAAIKAKSNK
ncbi:MAG: hypothetical protein ACI93R_001630 [Flavobacteriales bacterium]|jgi:hypothetical protein